MKECYTCKWWSCYHEPERAWSEVTVDSAVTEFSCGHMPRVYDLDGEDLDTEVARKLLAMGHECTYWEPLEVGVHEKAYLPNPWADEWLVEYNKECREKWYGKVG